MNKNIICLLLLFFLTITTCSCSNQADNVSISLENSSEELGSFHYMELFKPVGILIKKEMLPNDISTVRFKISDSATQEPLVNEKLIIQSKTETIELISDKNGFFLFPIKQTYINENPIIKSTRGKGTTNINLNLTTTTKTNPNK